MAGDLFSVETLSVEQVAKTIDHSLLRPELETEAVRVGCELARNFNVASACVKPCDVALARRLLAGSEVKVSTVIGFPHGSSTSAVKAFEAERAIAEGAEELDMVLNIGRLRSGAVDEVRSDIQAVVKVAAGQALVKVILENAYLDKGHKVLGCRLSEEAGADFVKTSTGFAPSGATLEDLRLMRRTVSPAIGVKAAGGIRTLDALIDALNAGATRIGATATQSILEELETRKAQS
ncbi:MAG TPA: deoxyribose-phosphate aldolase [Gaiellaceae bacterium]|jgi:deoxyribose-phosphate aldolase